jgi:RNA polymerase primary sigma factor
MAGDATAFWLDSAGRQPLLTAAEELHLGSLVRAWQDWEPTPDAAPAAVQRRGRRARDRFVAANLRLVAHVCRITRPGLGAHVTDTDLPDVFQAGAMGLTRGAEKFDPSRGYKFSTYAYWWIRMGIGRWLDQSSRIIRLPGTHAPKLARLGRVGERLTAELGRPPSRQELADALNMAIADLDLVLTTGIRPRSLDAPVGDEDGSCLGELMAAPTSGEPGPELDALHERLAGLDPLSARLVRGRWGCDGEARSLRQLAADEGLRPGRVRQLVAAAEQQLREGAPVVRALPGPCGDGARGVRADALLAAAEQAAHGRPMPPQLLGLIQAELQRPPQPAPPLLHWGAEQLEQPDLLSAPATTARTVALVG